jgi:hypothetical protein
MEELSVNNNPPNYGNNFGISNSKDHLSAWISASGINAKQADDIYSSFPQQSIEKVLYSGETKCILYSLLFWNFNIISFC